MKIYIYKWIRQCLCKPSYKEIESIMEGRFYYNFQYITVIKFVQFLMYNDFKL